MVGFNIRILEEGFHQELAEAKVIGVEEAARRWAKRLMNSVDLEGVKQRPGR